MTAPQAPAPRDTDTARPALVELDHVSKYYGNIKALENVSLEVHAGRSPVSSGTTARASPPSSRSSRGCTGTMPGPS